MAKGPLKESEKRYIRENCLNQSDRALSEALNRDARTIKKYRENELGVKKGRGGKIISVKKEDSDEKIKPDKNSPKTQEYYRIQLQQTEYFKILQEQLSEQELEYYKEQWGVLAEQFSDIVATEKRQIDELIKLEIIGNRIMTSIKNAENELRVIESEIEEISQKHNLV